MQFSAEDFLDDGDDVDDKTGLLSGQIAEKVEDVQPVDLACHLEDHSWKVAFHVRVGLTPLGQALQQLKTLRNVLGHDVRVVLVTDDIAIQPLNC